MTRFAPGTFTPRPGRGSLVRMLAAQSGTELRLALRNGEQVLLTLLIPVVLLIGLTTLDLVPLPTPRVQSVVPGILALAVMSTAFTGQAIALGFDRRYGVIRRLAATALPRWLLVGGRLAAVLGQVAVQVVVLAVLAAMLGWRPNPAGLGAAVLLVLLGCAAFGSLGILLGGTLRAEIVLAVANVVWFVLLLAGGIIIPLGQLPEPLATITSYLPSGALRRGAAHRTGGRAGPEPRTRSSSWWAGPSLRRCWPRVSSSSADDHAARSRRAHGHRPWHPRVRNRARPVHARRSSTRPPP